MTTETTPAAAAETPAQTTTPAPEAATQEQTTTQTQPPAAETQDTGTPTPQEGQPEGGDDASKRQKKTAGEYIGELKQQRNAWRARAEAAEARVSSLAKPLQEPGPNATQDEVDRFNVKSAVREAQAEDAKREAQEAQVAAHATMRATFEAKCDAAHDRMPGLKEQFLALPVVSQEVAEFVADSEKGAEVAYFLTQNPSEATRISRLHPYQQGIELGRIESRLSAPAPKQVSTAPRPAPVLNGGSSPPAFDIHKASVEDVAQRLKKAGII